MSLSISSVLKYLSCLKLSLVSQSISLPKVYLNSLNESHFSKFILFLKYLSSLKASYFKSLKISKFLKEFQVPEINLSL